MTRSTDFPMFGTSGPVYDSRPGHSPEVSTRRVIPALSKEVTRPAAEP
jgi:hypothetical protein